MWNATELERECSKKLCEDFWQLFLDKDNSDVEIVCEDKTFNCHQLILSARSPVFRAMFKTDMVEKRSQKVEIKELSSEVVAQMLNFIYTGSTNLKIENTPELLFELLSAADQYQLELLKKVSEKKLTSTLTNDNCVKMLVLAEIYHADNLEKVAMEWVIQNMHGLIIKNSEDWSNMIKNHPDLAIKVMKQWANEYTSVKTYSTTNNQLFPTTSWPALN